ncbi:unknown [Prevotella sp. CAG:487]|nr:unknown [Prevotella sp. CAG:487]
MHAGGKRACFQFPGRGLPYAKVMQGECNSKSGKPGFTVLDTAEPKLTLCKGNANEWKESLLSVS